jgi:hypothetical protein
MASIYMMEGGSVRYNFENIHLSIIPAKFGLNRTFCLIADNFQVFFIKIYLVQMYAHLIVKISNFNSMKIIK